MLNEPTIEKLRGLRLGALADAWLEQQGNADLQALGFDERLAMLVDAEWLDRQNKKLARNLREAKQLYFLSLNAFSGLLLLGLYLLFIFNSLFYIIFTFHI